MIGKPVVKWLNFIKKSGWLIAVGITSIVASRLHHQGKKVKLFNDRSFSTISAVPGAHIEKALTPEGQDFSLLGRALGNTVSFII